MFAMLRRWRPYQLAVVIVMDLKICAPVAAGCGPSTPAVPLRQPPSTRPRALRAPGPSQQICC
ncbi:hypothetical protein BD289DRAFT_424899 [Coniella lustricola]|uniref:Secreted protein n=1 Tax=Coniella lustricola TaxID=2025994 RepID=A0A2T3AHW7_9PEZI|nr:hypothetical protein BD289DRAFT_424899 [Coniella lustricola]